MNQIKKQTPQEKETVEEALTRCLKGMTPKEIAAFMAEVYKAAATDAA